MAMGAIIGSISHALPDIACVLGIAWYAVQLYDRFRHKRPLDDDPTETRRR